MLRSGHCFSYLTDGSADHFEVKDMNANKESFDSNGIFQVFSQYGQNKWTQWPIEEAYAKHRMTLLLDESLKSWSQEGHPSIEAVSTFKEYRITY